MNLLWFLFIAGALLILGYFVYGRFLSRLFHLNDGKITPACEFRDENDFVPAGKFYLLGQHLSAIAAAGPIIGPILAGMWFGWLPTLIWIVAGGIFVGGVHDFASMIASIRHQGRSIAEVIRENMSKKAFILFLLFLWFSIIYIVTAFMDITASTFVDERLGPQVASSSMMYLGLAFLMGVTLRYTRIPLLAATAIFLPLVFVCIYLGPVFPLKLIPIAGLSPRVSWDILLLIYCFWASVIPVWLLLQPRGYLGGFFLILTAGVSFIGILVGGMSGKFTIQYPAFKGWFTPQGFPLLPVLFTTVACGACSGFHAIVSSGTTSKQISRESDSRLVGFGGMLLESFVALIALSTLMIVGASEGTGVSDPNRIYANGIADFLGKIGVDRGFALNFALLAFTTFVYDTIDVATRLGRYIFQELTGWRGNLSSYAATFATLVLPAIFVTRNIKDAYGNVIPAWKLFWPVFGASNQLLAAMALLGLSVWLFRRRMGFLAALIPGIFMIIVSVLSLYFILRHWGLVLDPVIITITVLLVLAFLLIMEACRVFYSHHKAVAK